MFVRSRLPAWGRNRQVRACSPERRVQGIAGLLEQPV